MDPSVICEFAGRCSGCTDWNQTVSDQRTEKQELLKAQFLSRGLNLPAKTSWAEIPQGALRDRLDFQIQGGRLGLWSKDKSEIVDLPICLQLSPHLQAWLTEFRTLKIPSEIRRGSLRLRVAPNGERGTWLDFANEDIQFLFQEKTFLRSLSDHSSVEIGQRRKELIWKDGEPSLSKKGQFRPWMLTRVGDVEVPLFLKIADFSQVGHVSNRVILQSLQKLTPTSEKIFEFGAGCGNLSFALIEKCASFTAFESDLSSAAAFEGNRAELSRRGLLTHNQVTLRQGDFQKQSVQFENANTVVANPPRSGLGGFLSHLGASKVQNLIYLSCYPESMLRNVSSSLPDWICSEIILIDQFPRTPHVEVMGLWTRPLAT